MDEERQLLGISPEEWSQTLETVRAALLTLLDMVKELNAKVQLLEAQLKQTSRNSSKPPSSEPPSDPPAPPRVPHGRPAGAQHFAPARCREG